MQTSKGLKELAKQRGIKYFSRMSKKKLCEAIGISLVRKPTKITFKNTATELTRDVGVPTHIQSIKGVERQPGPHSILYR
jgi:ribosomal protein L7Ae-like RNA K-turn-binding protein